MTDDLHNIDDLFREGLEGHEEEVPRSVWQGVSSDLDKKQASFYKRKYYRLKRLAWLLVLLCGVGGGYSIIHMLNGKQASENVGKSATTQASGQQNNEKKLPSKDENVLQQKNEKHGAHDSMNTVSNTPEQLSEKKEGENVEPEVSVREPVSGMPDQQMKRKQTKTQTVNTKKRLAITETDVLVNSQLADDRRDQEDTLTEKKTVDKKKRKVIPGSESQASVITTHPLAITDFPLLERNTHWPEFRLHALSENHMPSVTQQTVSSSRSNGQHGFSLSVFAAPNFSFDRLEDDNRLAGPGRDRRDARRDEKHNISFSAGLVLNYEIAKNWDLQSGIGITSSSTSIAPKMVYAKADNSGHAHYELHCSSGYVYLPPKGGTQPSIGDSAQTAGSTSKLIYVSIPASLSYHFSLGHFTISPTFGAGLNILTSNKTETTFAATSESTTTSISGLKSNYAEGRLGLGIEYGLTKKLSLGMRPNARIALSPINRETPVKSYQNFLSLETGVRVKF